MIRRRRRVLAIGGAIAALGLLGVGAVGATSRSSDEAALKPARHQSGNQLIERKVDHLLRQMTLAEKLDQLQLLSDGQITDAEAQAGVGSVFSLTDPAKINHFQHIAVEQSRLHIPILFAYDTIHGYRTIFPIPLGAASSFDPSVATADDTLAARETATVGIKQIYSPMVDVSHEPRWGRIAEGAGEDPVVGSAFAAAKVRGFQGKGLAGMGTTAKHFVVYGAAAAGREYAETDVSQRTVAEIYLPPFRAAVEAGTTAIMPAFSTLAGIPMTAHRQLLVGVLREQWGFDGVVISDYNAITELMKHGVAADLADAAMLALRAGVDIDMMGFAYERGLPEALKRGTVTMAEIDAAVMRVLVLKDRLGLFDDPYRNGWTPLPSLAERRATARKAGARSLVLAQNRGDLLPLSPGIKRLAVIGPLADARAEMIGSWSAAGKGDDAVSPLTGLRAALPGVEITHVEGTGIASGEADFATAVAAARAADCVILCVGEAALMSGEAASRTSLDLPGRKGELVEAVSATGKPIIALLFCGRPVTIPSLVEKADALLICWFPGSEAGHAIADVLTGKVNPGGHLPVTWPRNLGQVPITYDARPTGRPKNPAEKYTSKYIDSPNSPQFAFGHGLSYRTRTAG